MFLIIPVLSLSSCSGLDDACADRCQLWGEFLDTCLPDLEEWGLSVDCHPDPEAYVAYMDAHPEDYEGANDAGLTEDCTSGEQAYESCMGVVQAEWDALETDEEREAYAADCEPSDEWGAYVEAKDCEGFLEDLFGG